MMTSADRYAALIADVKAVGLLNSCSAVLQWDQQTFMPRKGAALRGEQVGLLAKLGHQQFTEPRVGELLSSLEADRFGGTGDPIAAANLREIRHAYDRATKMPPKLVEELARVTTYAQESWMEARAANRFDHFRPWLEQVVNLKREEVAAVSVGQAFASPYDALLDEYEPGATSRELVPLFAELTQKLSPMVAAIVERNSSEDDHVLSGDYPIDRQKWFAESAAAAIGFDFQAGRLDQTTHPFCTGFGPGDCRITTRYNPKAFHEAFFGVIHETGHGLYEQNLPAEHFGTPAGAYCSLGIHESQSRLWENMVARSRPFWQHFYPQLRRTFLHLSEAPLEQFHRAINRVRPSFIRVEADEFTYNLHIALRFEIETKLVDGSLSVADLPTAWNERFEALFGLRPQSDKDGCLQDIHWSFGGIGYFPTYTLGNLYAAQFLATARKQLGEDQLDRAFAAGEFHPLAEWLTTNIHAKGRQLRAAELCVAVTGDSLRTQPFFDYLQGKSRDLFGIG